MVFSKLWGTPSECKLFLSTIYAPDRCAQPFFFVGRSKMPLPVAIAGKPLKRPKSHPQTPNLGHFLTSDVIPMYNTFLSWRNRLVALMKLFSLRRTVSILGVNILHTPLPPLRLALQIYRKVDYTAARLDFCRYTVATADSRRLQSSCDCPSMDRDSNDK